MSNMRTSAAGRQAIRNFEGLRLNAYPDAGGVWTIGYGTTRVDGEPVQPGMQITRERAEALLELDLLEFERAVNELVAVPLTQPQFDALVSFAYNVGTTALRNSTLLRKLNAGDTTGAADELLRWNQAGGQVLDGLSRRRAAERALFLSQPAGPLAPGGTSPPPEAPAPAAPESKPYVWTDPDVDRFPGSTGGRSDSSGQPADVQSPADESGPPPRIPPAPPAASPGRPAMSPLLIPAISAVVDAIPSLVKLFGSGSKVAERNGKAVEVVAEVVKSVTGAASVAAGAEQVLADPAVRAKVEQAVQDRWFDLSEAGGGGIEGARAADAEHVASGEPLHRSPSFVVAAMLIPLVYLAMVSVSLKLPFLPDWPSDIRVAIISSVVGMVLGGIVGYYFGMMTSRNRAPATTQ